MEDEENMNDTHHFENDYRNKIDVPFQNVEKQKACTLNKLTSKNFDFKDYPGQQKGKRFGNGPEFHNEGKKLKRYSPQVMNKA